MNYITKNNSIGYWQVYGGQNMVKVRLSKNGGRNGGEVVVNGE
jgi:hypothetical protein